MHVLLSPVQLSSSSPAHRFQKLVGLVIGKQALPHRFIYWTHYMLQCWLLREAPGAEYMKQIGEHELSAGFISASVTERKHVTDWLEGKFSDNERIAPAFPVSYILTQTYSQLAESTTPPGTPDDLPESKKTICSRCSRR
jgi:hypothetical protein